VTFREVAKRFTFIEILKGLALTFRKMLTKAVTVQYPKEKRKSFFGSDVAPGFRGLQKKGRLVRRNVLAAGSV
jgi:formate hydrogenlyase subunit 6/NADH:ubiquinone oxidoreductase subunit I